MGVTVKGREIGVLDAIARLEKFAESPIEVLNEFAIYAKLQHIKAVQGRYEPATGKPWQPLKPSTIAQRKATGKPSGTILGTLYTEVTGDSMTIGYDSPIAPFQHYGVSVPARTIVPKNKKALYWVGASHPVGKVNQPAFNVPARPRIGFSQTDFDHLAAIYDRHLQEAWDQ